MAEAAPKTPEATETKVPARREEVVSPFDTLRREVDRLFDEFRPAGWRLPFRRPSASS
jgi:HSP20 family protein